jgi:hypothetical protein
MILWKVPGPRADLEAADVGEGRTGLFSSFNNLPARSTMIITSVLRDNFRRREVRESLANAAKPPCILNVGGGSKRIPIPEHYKGWNHLLLDIDAAGRPDVVCDARNLVSLGADKYDAIYCSHNLEHYYKHDLQPSGFAEIRVPDLKAVMERFVAANMDIEDVLY